MSDSTKYTSKLTASRILIIGGSSGLGYAVAEACIEHGATVVISSSNAQRVHTAVEKIQQTYPSKTKNIHGLTVNLSSPNTLEDDLEKVLKDAVGVVGGKLDHIVYTAGDALATLSVTEMTMEKIIKAGQVRFFAPLLLAKFVPRYLEESYKSSYTITTGAVSEKPRKDWSVIGSYAGGHHSMVRNLALDLKPIRVNGISPGAVDTELWRVSGKEREEMMKKVGENMATGRAGRPEDVAESFLAVLKDGNMTGSMIRTDGGGLFM